MKKHRDEKKIVLSLKDIHYSYNGEMKVLRGVNLDAYQGDVIVILGKSRAGKSTLLKCINLSVAPDKGEMLFLGRKFSNLKNIGLEQQKWISKEIGMVPQGFRLFHNKTVLQNVADSHIYALKRINQMKVIQEVHRFFARTGISIDFLSKGTSDDKDRAQRLLRSVGIPQNLETRYPLRLSKGERQRVAIARSLMSKPSLILLDEATSSFALDKSQMKYIMKLMRSLIKEQITMIILTHSMEFARKVANRAMFLHEGRIVMDGKPEPVIKNYLLSLSQKNRREKCTTSSVNGD